MLFSLRPRQILFLHIMRARCYCFWQLRENSKWLLSQSVPFQICSTSAARFPCVDVLVQLQSLRALPLLLPSVQWRSCKNPEPRRSMDCPKVRYIRMRSRCGVYHHFGDGWWQGSAHSSLNAQHRIMGAFSRDGEALAALM